MTEEVTPQPAGSKLDLLIAQAEAEIVQSNITIRNLETRISRLHGEIAETQHLLDELRKVKV